MSETTGSTTETKRPRSELAKLLTKLTSLKKRLAKCGELEDEIADVKQLIADALDSE